MFKDFIVDKISREIRLLEQLRYQNVIPVKEMIVTEEPKDFVYPGFIRPNKSSKKMTARETWKGRDQYLWLHTEFQLPKEWKNLDVLAVFDFSGDGNSSAFESLVFLNGVPYQGIDSNHTEVFFSSQPGKNEPAKKPFVFDIRLWSGIERGGPKQIMNHQIKKAFFCTLEPCVDELYYLLSNMILTTKELQDDDPVKSQLENILAEGYKYIDLTNPGSKAFVDSVEKALEYYHKALKTCTGQKNINISFIGHTHIDLAYLWRYRHAKEKGERSFSIVLRLMERYPEYFFLQTQAQLYKSIKEEHPELFKAMAKRISEGRWEASGAMWVEADCNIPSGESLVRQILYGKRFFKKEFGVENNFLWLPDVFGYNWALPQILRKSGIDTFITTKISWSETNRMPHDTFTWTGMDGSTILTHFITTPDAGNARYYTYNGEIMPKTVKGIWSNYRDKALNQNLLFAYGHGDGGGGVTRNMLESLRAMEKIPGLPAIKTERVDEYLKRLHKKVSSRGAARVLHNWDRELYLEFHRGTYTSQAYTKKMNRKLELLYRDVEILQSLAALKTKKWDEQSWAELEEGWKLILKNQFHDIIPGSSIAEVYEDARQDHSKAFDMAHNAKAMALANLISKDAAFTVINTAGWKRGGLVKLPVPQKGKLYTGEKGAFITQISSMDGEKAAYVYAQTNTLGTSHIQQESSKDVDGPKIGRKNKFMLRKNGVDTPFYKIKWDSKGRLSSIWDKQAKREVLKGPGNELQIFEDRPRVYDAWEIESFIDLKKEIIDNLVSVKIEESGPLFTRIRFVRNYNKSKITQDMIVYTMHKRIDFKTQVDWQERSKLLKVSFPVDIRAVTARYEIQYGSLERNATRSTSWDEAQFEVVAHQWADYSETNFGVSLLNDCKYGYDIKEGVMRLSLLKSAERPDMHADRGLHEFTYALYVHSEPWHKSDLIPLAWDLNAPLITVPGKPMWNTEKEIISINSEGIALDAIKKSEDGKDLIMRFHEMHGGRTILKIDFNVPVSGWVETNLMEELQTVTQKALKKTTQQSYHKGSIKRELLPFEIVTFRVKL